LYEMLSGRKPFDGDSLTAVLLRIVSTPHAPLAGVPPALAAAVDRCLQKHPAARFRSAGELADALSSVTFHEEPQRLVESDAARQFVHGVLAKPISRAKLRALLLGAGDGLIARERRG